MRISIYLLFLLCCVNGLRGQADPGQYLARARELAGNAAYVEARDLLAQAMKEFPADRDIETLYAKLYSWEGNYAEARSLLNRVTSQHREEHEAWMASVRNELYAGNPGLALGLADKGLRFHPGDAPLLELREEALASMRAANSTEKSLFGDEGLFLRSSASVFSKSYRPMYSQELGAIIASKFLKLVPAVQYDRRFEQEGLQYKLEVYPRLSKKVYAALDYAYSADGLFPSHRTGGELFYGSGGWEFSAGGRYYAFTDGNARVYTLSAGTYQKNYYLSGRAYMTPKEGAPPALSGSLLGRKYFKDVYHFLGVRLGYGYNTELRQLRAGQELLSETLLFVETQQIELAYQWHGGGSSLWRATANGQRQEFAFDPGNYFISLTLGMEYRFRWR